MRLRKFLPFIIAGTLLLACFTEMSVTNWLAFPDSAYFRKECSFFILLSAVWVLVCIELIAFLRKDDKDESLK